jgi:hypothetical protein
LSIITLEDLSRAISKRLEIEIEEAKKYAHTVIDFFGFEDRIIDNILNPDERRLFYLLQELGILGVDREEITLYNGNAWRMHYWRLEKKTIMKYSNGKKLKKDSETEKETYNDVYSSVQQDMWTTRKKSSI